jgi:MFS family permease
MNLVSKIDATFRITFASLRYRDFRHFWLGQCVSLIGTWMQRTAQVWLIYSLTKSPLMVGVLGVCQFIPILLFSLFAGILVDRFPKRHILLLTQTVFMFQAFTLAALTYFEIVRYWHVFILSAVFGLTQALDMPSRQSFFIDMVGRKDLMNAISLNSTIVNLAKIIGPAISGIMLVRFGSALCFFSNGLSYLAVIWGLLLIKTNRPTLQSSRNHALKQIQEGLRYIKKSPVLMNNVIITAIVCTFAMNHDVLIPVFAKAALGKGASGYTALMSAAGIGSFVAALVMANLSKNGIRKQLLIIDALGISILQIVISFITDYRICLGLIFCIGFMNLTFMNTANSIFQLHSADEYRGRVISVYTFLNQGSTPIGNFYAGAVMEQLGGRYGFLLCGLATLLLVVSRIVTNRASRGRVPDSRQKDRNPPPFKLR